MPAITVIMPVYNTQQHLNWSIHSLMKQSFADFELLLVNDGSTDYSMLYCNALAKQDSRIRVLDLPHGGIAAARIAGLREARGDYVGFMDSDDLVEKEYLLHLYQAIRAEDADISMCQYVCDYADRSVVHSFPSGAYRGDGLQELILSGVFCRDDRSRGTLPLFLWNKLFRRALLMDNINYLDRRVAIGEDTLLFLAALLSCKCFTVIGDCDYHYCMRENATTRKKRAVDFDGMLLFRSLEKEILEHKGFAVLTDKVDAVTVHQLARIIKRRDKAEIPPLPEELKELIKTQAATDGSEQWRETVKSVTDYYLSEEENK